TALEKGLTGKMAVVKPAAASGSAAILAAVGTTAASSGSPAVAAPRLSETNVRPPTGAPSPAVDATVTLRPRHLATVGILIVALVIGGGVLAFIALRRPATVIVPAATAGQSSTAVDASVTTTAAATQPTPVETSAPP